MISTHIKMEEGEGKKKGGKMAEREGGGRKKEGDYEDVCLSSLHESRGGKDWAESVDPG